MVKQERVEQTARRLAAQYGESDGYDRASQEMLRAARAGERDLVEYYEAVSQRLLEICGEALTNRLRELRVVTAGSPGEQLDPADLWEAVEDLELEQDDDENSE